SHCIRSGVSERRQTSPTQRSISLATMRHGSPASSSMSPAGRAWSEAAALLLPVARGLNTPSFIPPANNTRYQAVREDRMRYKPKSTAALYIVLGGLPDKMRVEVDPDIRVSAKTVGELRKVTAWPENLAVTTPQEGYPESSVKVNKANVATRVTPKT